jgi:hypothetical protein
MRFRFDPEAGNGNGPISIRNGPRIARKRSGNMRVAVKKKTRTTAKISMKFEVLEEKLWVDLPIQTKSEANCFEPWRVRHARHREQQRLVALGLNPIKSHVRLPCRIMLTRFAPDRLDAFDNLPVSFKYIVDSVCAIITGEYRAGKADSDERITIACDQVKSAAYGIRIEITW